MNRCTICGKEFDYPPALSRAGKGDLCRICSAQEALEVTPISETDKEQVLAEIASHEKDPLGKS